MILSDRKPGHWKQSLAVLEAIKERRKSDGFSESHTHAQTIEISFKNNFWKNFLGFLSWGSAGYFPGKAWFLKKALEKACFERLEKA